MVRPQTLHFPLHKLPNWLFGIFVLDIGLMYGLVWNNEYIYHLEKLYNDFYYLVNLLLAVYFVHYDFVLAS